MESEDYELLWNRKIFIDTIIDLTKFIGEKAKTSALCNDHQYIKLQDTCLRIQTEIVKSDSDSSIDSQLIIKKIYKTMSAHLDKILAEPPDPSLFSIKNLIILYLVSKRIIIISLNSLYSF